MATRNEIKEAHIKRDIELIEQILEAIIAYESNQVNIKQTVRTIGKLAGEISHNSHRDKDKEAIIASENEQSSPKERPILIAKRKDRKIGCEGNHNNLKRTLIKIGELAGKISHNIRGDKANEYIRNKYGYLQRNKEPNKDGIYFEYLYRLNRILTNDQIAMSITEEEINKLGNHLLNLKKKIAHILMDQNPSIHQNLVNGIIIDFSAPISDIIDFAKKYYEQLILQRIIDEIDQWEKTYLAIKDSRYYFARVFCNYGELFNDWFEDREIDENNQVQKVLKCFVKLRNQLMHQHGLIRVGINRDTNFKLSIMIIRINEHLKRMIVKKRDWEINLSYPYSFTFNDLMDRFLKAFPKIDKDKQINEINSFVSLIRKAGEIIKTQEGNTNLLSIKSQLKKLDGEYQLNILGLGEYRRKLFDLETDGKIKFPSKLDLNNRDAIRKFINCANSPKFKCIIKLYEFICKIILLEEEAQYLVEFIRSCSNDDLRTMTRRQKYVIQYIMVVIGEIVRDIEKSEMCKLNANNSSVSKATFLSTTLSHFIQFFSLYPIRESETIIRQTRDNLAHKVFGFNENNFLESLSKLGPVHLKLHLFCQVIMKNLTPTSAEDFACLGMCFLGLGLNAEAIDYLKEAVNVLDKAPIEVDPIGDGPDSLYTKYKSIFQMTPFYSVVLQCLMKAYRLVDQMQKAFEISTILFNKINRDKIGNLSDLNDEIIRTLKYFIFIRIYFNPGKFEESIQLLEQYDSNFVEADINLAFAQCYFNVKNYEKAKEKLKKIFEHPPNCIDEFIALNFYVKTCLINPQDGNQDSKINDHVDRMVELVNVNNSLFKSMYRDDYLVKNNLIVGFGTDLINNLKYMANHSKIDKHAASKIRNLSCQLSEFKSEFPDKPETGENCIGYVHKLFNIKEIKRI